MITCYVLLYFMYLHFLELLKSQIIKWILIQAIANL